MLIPLKDENPTESFPWVTISLIAANIAIFLYELSLGPKLGAFVGRFALVPNSLVAAPLSPDSLTRIFASLFLHAGLIHVGGNMLYLWIFGNNVEDVLGHGRFLLFYALAGIGAAAGYVISAPTSGIMSIGASGAVSGVLAAYLVLYPQARVLTVIPIFFFVQIARIPAVVVIGMWIVLQFISGIGSLSNSASQMTGGIAWFAHIGGFLTGLLLIFAIPKRRQPKVLRQPREIDW